MPGCAGGLPVGGGLESMVRSVIHEVRVGQEGTPGPGSFKRKGMSSEKGEKFTCKGPGVRKEGELMTRPQGVSSGGVWTVCLPATGGTLAI